MNKVVKALLIGAVGVLGATSLLITSASADNRTGYIYSPEVSTANGGWNWLENGKPYTGFRYYMGTYYWFVNGVRQNAGWRDAWGMRYYTDDNGRAVQGNQAINGTVYSFGDNGTFFLRGKVKDAYVPVNNSGWRWVTNGANFTGFRFYMGAYYWFQNGVRQNSQWETAWGMNYYVGRDGRAVQGLQTINNKKYYFGNDGTFYSRAVPGKPTYFSQWDGRWSGTWFNGGTFGATGCVPSSIAMIMNGSYGVNTTPRDVANRLGGASMSYGASGRDLVRMVNSFGHTTRNLTTPTQVKDALRDGYPVIFLINVGIGHAVAAYGYSDGNTEVFDPYNHQFYNGWNSVDGLIGRLSADPHDWDAGTPVFAIE
ncbi:MAG TPA: C39 family peptidase [Weissella cibaria]|nr:C39 family peptidase [Weissella cibaria]